METVDRQFKAKGIFEVSFAKPGAELMLDGGGMNTRQRAGIILTAKPPGEGTADQVALIVTASPVAASVEGDIHHLSIFGNARWRRACKTASSSSRARGCAREL